MAGPTEPIFVPFMCHLRAFEVHIDPLSVMDGLHIMSLMIRSLCISLTSPATLEYLKVDISELREEFFDYDSFFEDLRDADVWRHLDSIITHPIGSRLKKVDIHIGYHFPCHAYEPQVAKTILSILPLLCRKGILFVETTAI